MPYAYDDEHEPIVLVRLSGKSSDADLRQMFGDLDELLTHERDFGLVVDCAELDASATGWVTKLFEWLGDNAEAANSWLRGIVFVSLPAALADELQAALQARKGVPVPLNKVKTTSEGSAWIQAKLDPSRSGRYRILD